MAVRKSGGRGDLEIDSTVPHIDEAARERLRRAPGVIHHRRSQDWNGWSFTPIEVFEKPVDVLSLLGRREQPFEDVGA